MQYLRVLVVVLLTPLLIAVFGGGGVAAGAGEAALRRAARLAVDRGDRARRRPGRAAARVPAGALLGPMLVAGALTLAGVEFAVPPVVRESAFALIGLQVGLRFTTETIRLLGRVFGPVLVALAALIVGSFGLAVVLTLTTPVSLQDAYLATTPGGIYAVLAVAVGAGSNTTFILAVQTARVLVAVLLAPLAVRRIARPGRPSQ